MCVLKIEDLCVKFHNQQWTDGAVNHLSFEIGRGEIVGLVGESGCGKTTAMRALLGLLPDNAVFSAGKMEIDGKVILSQHQGTGERIPTAQALLRGRMISMVFQEPSAYLDHAITIGNQLIETIREHKNCSRKDAKQEAKKLLLAVGIDQSEQVAGQYPFELSGGMCQRVSIALALACKPAILIADEPVTALDTSIQRQILELLKKIAEESNMAVILVSHDLGAVASVCSRVLVMKDGNLVESGSVEDVFYSPRERYTRELMHCAADLDKGKPTVEAGKDQILILEHVSKSYQVTEAVRDVSFHINQGECFGLIGESGCGKTTLAKMITGLVKEDEGRICYLGQKTGKTGIWDRKRYCEGIGMIFQNPMTSLNSALTVEQIFTETIRSLELKERGRRMKKSEVYKCCRENLKKVGMDESILAKYPNEFSGGQRQRISIARALLGKPRLLICDEPVSALDLPIQKQILELLKELQEKEKMAYLFISHDLGAVKYICHRMGVMYYGSLVEMGETMEIFQSPLHPYTKMLLKARLLPDPVKAKQILISKSKKMEKEYPKEGRVKGCPYAEKCEYVMERCMREKPEMYRIGKRKVACHIYDAGEAQSEEIRRYQGV